MVAALKAPLPDGSQLAAFAAVLGDATEGGEAAVDNGTSNGTDANATSEASQSREAHEAPASGTQTASHGSNDEDRGGKMEAGSFQHVFHGHA